MNMEKHRINDDHHGMPAAGKTLTVPLVSPDGQEEFLLDISRGGISIKKVKLQNRAREIVVLFRLELNGPPHRNPDDEEVPTPHIHMYREGYGAKYAYTPPSEYFTNLSDEATTLREFLVFCKITKPPHLDPRLFP